MIVTINTQSAASVKLRSAPDPEASAVGILTNGLKCTADYIQGAWLHVTTPAGKKGFVSAAFVDGQIDGVWDTIKSTANKAVTSVKNFFTGGSNTATPTATASTTSNKMYVTGNSVRLRSTADASKSNNIVTTLNKGEVVTADTKKSTGSWTYITTQGGKSGYMSSAYLSTTAPTTTKSTTSTTTKKTTTTTTTNNAVPAVVSLTSNTQNSKNGMTLSENARKYIKWGAIALLAGGAGYCIYKAVKSPSATATASSSKSKSKGLNGVPRLKSRKSKRKGSKGGKHKCIKF